MSRKPYVSIDIVSKLLVPDTGRAVKHMLECSCRWQGKFQVDALNRADGGTETVSDQGDVRNRVRGKDLLDGCQDSGGTCCLSRCKPTFRGRRNHDVCKKQLSKIGSKYVLCT